MMNKGAIIAASGLVALQVIDVAVHIATDQIEPIRIVSNVVLSGWALSMMFGWASRAGSWIAIALYLALNGGFLSVNGLTNPEMDGAVRYPLFAFIGLSTLMALFILMRLGRSNGGGD